MRAHRKDLNHKEITDILTKLNIAYIDLHMVGNGCPDILFGLCNYNFIVEIKSKRGTLTEKEIKVANKWQGYIIIAFCFEDIIRELRTYSEIVDDDALLVIINYLNNFYEKNIK